MFNETIREIKAEIVWINYELTRQSTSTDQAEKLIEKREKLHEILLLCHQYQNPIHIDNGSSKSQAKYH